MKFDITHDGRTTLSIDGAGALALGYPEDAIDAAEAAAAAIQTRDKTRARITAGAGDPMSLLGTTSDTAGFALLGVLALVAAAGEATTPEDWLTGAKARVTALGGDHDLFAAADAFLANVADGTIRVPALIKGLDVVTAEVAARSTAVADAMTQAEA